MNSSRTNQRNITWITDLLYLFIFLIFFYTLWLGSYPLFTPDEGRYSEIAREMIVNGDYVTPKVNGVIFLDKPVLFYWLQVIAIFLFGVKEWALRLMPALIGIGGCLITYLCARRLFGRLTGLLSSAILASSPLYFGASHYANLDLEVAVLLNSSLLFFICGMYSQDILRRRFLLGAYFCSGLAVLAKGLIGFVLPVGIILTWISCQQSWHYLKKIYLVYGIILFLLVVMPWYLLVQYYNPEFFHYFFIVQHFSRFLSTGNFNNASPIWFYFPVIVIGFSPWIIFLIASLKRQIQIVYQSRQEPSITLFLLLWPGIIFIFFSIPHSKIVGYILPIFQPLSILIGCYLSNIWFSISKKQLSIYVISYIIINICLILLLLFLKQRLDLPATYTPFLIGMIIIFSSAAIISLNAIRNHSLSFLFWTCFFSNCIFLLFLTYSAAHLNLNSSKSLVMELKSIKRSGDGVISYFKYYQDIPLYLGETIRIVADWNAPDILQKDNWRRELWYGKQFKQTDHFLIDEQAFWQYFHSDKRVFVFLNENYLEQFKSHATHYFYLAKENDIILLSNQPTLINETPTSVMK